jgi:hypothetical protein
VTVDDVETDGLEDPGPALDFSVGGLLPFLSVPPGAQRIAFRAAFVEEVTSRPLDLYRAPPVRHRKTALAACSVTSRFNPTWRPDPHPHPHPAGIAPPFVDAMLPDGSRLHVVIRT